MKLVLATRNRDKIEEIQSILSDLDVEIISLDSFPGSPVTVEDGETLEDNALKKATDIRDFTGISALADDTGLEVDVLNGAPGVFAGRFAGEDATYDDNCDKLLAEMTGVGAQDRGASFRSVIAVALSPQDQERLAQRNAPARARADALVADGVLPGRITESRQGTSGFGYDPIFLDTQSGKTLAEMTPEEKNATSHRYRALIEMRGLLLELGLVREAA